LLVDTAELAQSSAGKELHVVEIQQQLLGALVVDEIEKLFANDLNVLLVEDLLVDEIHHGHIADLFQLQTAAARLRIHGHLRERPNPKRGRRETASVKMGMAEVGFYCSACLNRSQAVSSDF